MGWRLLLRGLGLGLGAVMLAGQGVQAIDLSWQPQLRLGTRGTDNVRWSGVDEEAAWGFDTGGGVALKAAAANWNSAINPSFNFRRFPIGENLSADEYGVRSQHQYKVSDRLQTSLQADYVRDSTLSSELTDAGRRNDVADRDTLSIQPGVSYLISDSTAVNAGYGYTDVAFVGAEDQGLVNYSYQQWTLGSTHWFSDRLQGFVSGFITDFDVADVNSETWTYGGQVGVNYEWSDSLSTNMSVGYQTSTIEFLESTQVLVIDPLPRLITVLTPAQSSSSGPIANFGIKKQFEHTKAEFAYARRVSPSIRGAQTLEDDILLTADHELSKYWALGFRGGYNMRTAQAEEVGGTSRDLNRDQASIGASFTYKATKEISLRTEYRISRQTLAEASDTIYVNALFVTMSYNGEPHIYPGY